MRAARCQSSSGKVWWSKRSGRIASRRWWRVQRRTLLTPVSCSEAKVIFCIELAPERAVGGVGVAIVDCQLHVSFKSPNAPPFRDPRPGAGSLPHRTSRLRANFCYTSDLRLAFLLLDTLDIHATRKMRIAHAASHLLHRLLTSTHVCEV
jgi:hypothetical protein